MICDYCGKTMTRTNKHHINICQTTTNHVFCSKKCKDNWCFDIQKGNLNSEK
jgi:hypothetical protein